MKKPKPIPRCERMGKKERLFSTNFKENMESSGIKCYVPWEDFLSLKIRYEKLVKRRRREINSRLKEEVNETSTTHDM